MKKYLAIDGRANDGGWGAYVPDLPGLGVVDETREEAQELLVEGIRLHIAGMLEHGLPIPEPTSYAELVSVAA